MSFPKAVAMGMLGAVAVLGIAIAAFAVTGNTESAEARCTPRQGCHETIKQIDECDLLTTSNFNNDCEKPVCNLGFDKGCCEISVNNFGGNECCDVISGTNIAGDDCLEVCELDLENECCDVNPDQVGPAYENECCVRDVGISVDDGCNEPPICTESPSSCCEVNEQTQISGQDECCLVPTVSQTDGCNPPVCERTLNNNCGGCTSPAGSAGITTRCYEEPRGNECSTTSRRSRTSSRSSNVCVE